MELTIGYAKICLLWLCKVHNSLFFFIFRQRSTLLFDLWGSYDGDISTHPLLRKLTVLASSGQTKLVH